MTEQLKNYVKFTESVLSEQFHLDLNTAAQLYYHFNKVALHMEKLDHLKKKIFYNRDVSEHFPESYPMSDSAKELHENLNNLNQSDKHMIHFGLGKFTEAFEIFDMLLVTLGNALEIDKVNLIEEMGDSYWYDTIPMREYDIDFDETIKNNQEKLEKRFNKGKFTSENANNRDIENELSHIEK